MLFATSRCTLGWFAAVLAIATVAAGCAREPALEPGQSRVSVMSFNVRYDEPSDEFTWAERLPAIVRMIEDRRPAIIGLQEPLEHQVAQMAEQLDDYAWVGVGTTDGDRGGTFTPIFYRTDVFEVDAHGTFWLSDAPDVASRGWDAAQPRVVTWATLRPVGGEASITVFNTHFDHAGGAARAESAKLLATKADEIAPTGTVLITGDLNTVAVHPALRPLFAEFDDARSSAPVSDLRGSFNNWMTSYGLVNIDFVLYREATPARFETIDDDYGIDFLSDHFPIVATLHVDS